jgi:hypothetical protein
LADKLGCGFGTGSWLGGGFWKLKNGFESGFPVSGFQGMLGERWWVEELGEGIAENRVLREILPWMMDERDAMMEGGSDHSISGLCNEGIAACQNIVEVPVVGIELDDGVGERMECDKGEMRDGGELDGGVGLESIAPGSEIDKNKAGVGRELQVMEEGVTDGLAGASDESQLVGVGMGNI